MKKIIVIMSLVCLSSIPLLLIASNDKQIDFNRLPAQSKQFVKKFFPKQSIALIKMESEVFDKSYEVIFTNGDKAEFDKKGNWTEVDCKYAQVPVDVVPSQIRNYVGKNYPNSKITKIEKEARGQYEIELSNGMELKFNSKFNLIDIDN